MEERSQQRVSFKEENNMSKRQNDGKTRVGRRKAKMGDYVPLKNPAPPFTTNVPCPNCGKNMTKDANGMKCSSCGNPYGNEGEESKE